LVWCPPCRRIAWAAKREVELKPDTMPSRAVMRLVSSARPPPPSALSITPIFPLMKRLQAGGVRARQRDVHKTRRGMPLMAVCPSTSRCARTIISSSPQTNPCSNKLCSWYHCSASQPSLHKSFYIVGTSSRVTPPWRHVRGPSRIHDLHTYSAGPHPRLPIRVTPCA
jgi:hypothetical protein